MKNWTKQSRRTFGAAVVAAALALGNGVTGEAAANGFLAEVPVNDWSYGAVNDLIAAGVVPDYTLAIPEGRIMSRMEMAMIVDAAMQNQAAMNETQQAELKKLNEAYYYDIKKARMLAKLDAMDMSDKSESAFTPEEKEGLKKAAALADKLSISGYARLRNDHYLKDNGAGGTERSTRANMVHIAVNSTYKVNEDWQAHADIGYRGTFSALNPDSKSISPNEDHAGLTIDPYVTGRFPKLGLDVKAGKWNEWNIYGWGMDIDCDFAGIQLTQGKKKFKTFFTTGKMDLWDYAMGGKREDEQVTSLRFFYPFDDKNDINFGLSSSSAMASRYQDPDQGRVLYYFVHGHHVFDKNWQVRAGLINSNAKRDSSNPDAGSKTKQPGRWLQVQYKGADLNRPGSYGITATYRYEPALSWPTVTDWCGLNEKFIRLGVNYVPAKNIMLDTFYTWGREIDTDKRSDLYRFQAQLFF